MKILLMSLLLLLSGCFASGGNKPDSEQGPGWSWDGQEDLCPAQTLQKDLDGMWRGIE